MDAPLVPPALYRLIEAGQLARRAVLAPLAGRGLFPGDDAVLLGLGAPDGADDAELMALTGLGAAALAERLDRLAAHGLVEAVSGDSAATGATRLTDRGRRTYEVLLAHWEALDTGLLGSMPKKDRKNFRRALDRLVEELGG